MPFEIPIETIEQESVCKVVWDGELYDGVATVVAVPGRETDAANLRGMIVQRQDLMQVSYRSEGDKPSVKGWKAYEGVVGALRTILPSLGFQIGHIGGDMPALGKSRMAEVAFNSDQEGIE